jgi:HSP20 family protein
MAMLPARRRGQNLTLIDPTREFEDIYSRMGQLMNMAFGSALAPVAALTEAPWVPLADVSETDDAYQVHVEVPGIPKDQIDVQLQDRELVISGQTPEQQQEEGSRQHRNSRRMGRFEFRTYLPGDINPDGIRAELNDGVLTVTIPKSEAAKPRRVEISVS